MMDPHQSVTPLIPAPFNESIWLYDMNADEVFDRHKRLIADSSLGLVGEDTNDATFTGGRTAPRHEALARREWGTRGRNT